MRGSRGEKGGKNGVEMGHTKGTSATMISFLPPTHAQRLSETEPQTIHCHKSQCKHSQLTPERQAPVSTFVTHISLASHTHTHTGTRTLT